MIVKTYRLFISTGKHANGRRLVTLINACDDDDAIKQARVIQDDYRAQTGDWRPWFLNDKAGNSHVPRKWNDGPLDKKEYKRLKNRRYYAANKDRWRNGYDRKTIA